MHTKWLATAGKRPTPVMVYDAADYEELEATSASLLEALETIASMAPAELNQGYGELCDEYTCCHKMHALATEAIRKAT